MLQLLQLRLKKPVLHTVSLQGKPPCTKQAAAAHDDGHDADHDACDVLFVPVGAVALLDSQPGAVHRSDVVHPQTLYAAGAGCRRRHCGRNRRNASDA